MNQRKNIIFNIILFNRTGKRLRYCNWHCSSGLYRPDQFYYLKHDTWFYESDKSDADPLIGCNQCWHCLQAHDCATATGTARPVVCSSNMLVSCVCTASSCIPPSRFVPFSRNVARKWDVRKDRVLRMRRPNLEREFVWCPRRCWKANLRLGFHFSGCFG